MSEIKAEIVFSLSRMHLSGSNSKTPSTSFLARVTSYGAQLLMTNWQFRYLSKVTKAGIPEIAGFVGA
jgi:hypothetical protein